MIRVMTKASPRSTPSFNSRDRYKVWFGIGLGFGIGSV
jgi:hypothetical protein